MAHHDFDEPFGCPRGVYTGVLRLLSGYCRPELAVCAETDEGIFTVIREILVEAGGLNKKGVLKTRNLLIYMN
jgi:hypothetical protein